jgi:hypothetical protein
MIEGSIDYYKSVVYLSIYRGGGLDPIQTNFRANSVNLANNRSINLGTLNCSAHVRIVRPTGACRPDRGPSGLRTIRTADHPASGPNRPLAQLSAQHMPLPFGGAEQTKSN